MRIENKILFLWLFALTMIACQSEQPSEPDGIKGQPIVLSAGVDATVVTTGSRATPTTFPNTGRISVIADAVPEDWSSLYFNDMEAVTTDVNPVGGIYGFTWVSGLEQYWPLNGSRLALIAYSPKNPATITPSGKTLNVTLPANNINMPDLLYGSGVKYGDKSLANRNIDFGVFKHALSQLVVKLDCRIGAPVMLGQLSITTKSQATLDLLSGDLTVSPATNITYKYPGTPFTLTNGAIYTLQPSAGVPFLVYPDVAALNNTTIYISFLDATSGGNVLDLEKTLNISDFLNVDGFTPSKLERAKSIVLTITVTGTQILSAQLTGTIIPWQNMGDFGLTVE